MLNSPYQVYQQSSIRTASSGQLLIMLYEGAIRFTKLGIEGIKSKRYEAANTNFTKAQAIINELIASLNHDYMIANNLLQVYEYLLHLLISANVKKDETFAVEGLKHLTELLETWKQVVKDSASNTPKETGWNP